MSEIAVASTVYNLAGDVGSRPDLLKSHVIGGVARGQSSIGMSLIEGYRNSSAFCMLRFLEWTKNDPQFNAEIGSMDSTIGGSFYPVIPFRYNNTPVLAGQAGVGSMYPVAKKAFRRGFRANFDEVQRKILTNENVADIDHAYATFGVAFNVKDRSSRKYVYKFFQHLMSVTATYSAQQEADWFFQWRQDISYPDPPWREIRIEAVRTDGTRNWRTDLRWAFIHEETGSGLLKSNAKRDELWFEVLADPLTNYPDTNPPDGFNQQVVLNWQETSTTWRKLVITGLQHLNYVYGSTSWVQTTAKQALQTVGKESPFLVPIHDGVFELLPLVDTMQVASSCSFLVFSSYAEKQQEWYETWWFKVIVIAAIVVISVVAAVWTGGGSLGAGGASIVGLLTGAGLSTTAAIIIVAAAQALAGIFLAFLITGGTTAIFGEEWGPLIGAIISTIVSFGMSMGDVTQLIQELTKPDVWISLTMATGNGVASYLEAEAGNIAEETAKMLEEYGEKTAEVQRMYQEMVGSQGEIDQSLVNKYISEVTEKPTDFLHRTLVTGSDIVKLTLGQIENFVGNNLRLVLP